MSINEIKNSQEEFNQIWVPKERTGELEKIDQLILSSLRGRKREKGVENKQSLRLVYVITSGIYPRFVKVDKHMKINHIIEHINKIK